MRTTCDQNSSSVRCYLLELLPPKNKKWAKMDPEPKKRFFWLNSKIANTQKLKFDIQKVKMDGPILLSGLTSLL